MESRKHSSALTRRRVLGAIFLTVFSLAFIFSCMYKILPVGRAIVGTFGILTYPMLLFLMLISLAGFMGFSYTRSIKSTAYFSIAFLSLLLFIHSIATFKDLNLVVGGKSLVQYLRISYVSKLTLLGGAGSLVCGLISVLLGAMGSIVVFVILATLFSGLFIDYQFYGKYEQPHIKKLKTRALREKVQNSDKKKKSDGTLVYDHNLHDEIYSQNESVATVTATEEELNTTESIYGDYVGGYQNEEIETIEEPYQPYQPYQPYADVIETQSTEESTISQEELNQGRRDFITATWGGYGTSSPISNPEPVESEPIETAENDIHWGNDEVVSDDDDMSKILQILNQPDENIEDGIIDSGLDLDPEPEPIFKGFDPEPVQNTVINEPINPEPIFKGFDSAPVKQPPVFTPPPIIEPQRPIVREPIVQPPKFKQTPVVPTANGGSQGAMFGVRYNAPPLNLLATPVIDNGDYSAEQEMKAGQLERVLAAFSINAKVKNIVRGPKITRFELSVPLGTSVRKIPQYENDILAALAAKTVTIRAPIPGSTLVGVETENNTFTTVYQREIFECPAYQNFKDPLPITIGKDISGEIIVKSLTELTHMLIAGSTNSGKSVFIHNIVLSLIYRHSPEELKLVMIDPKRVEFPRYNGLPHLVTPEVIQGAEKAVGALRWCVQEMDRRYDLMAKAGFNNIKPYNKSELVKIGQLEKFPYIVIIVDELAEIMQANKKDSEPLIQRITQLARAAGIHLIVATQRPSVDIITGVIKNNIPTRVAFSLQSNVDSKTIIGTVGAEKLLGRGDMLFSAPGTSAMPRLQASYASDDEIARVVDFIKKNNEANYDAEVERIMEKSPQETLDSAVSGGGTFSDAPPPRDNLDSYFKTAVKIVMANGGASVSYLQRRLSIGYSRAAKIIDQMADRNYIGQATGSKPRPILITPEQFANDFGEEYNSID